MQKIKEILDSKFGNKLSSSNLSQISEHSHEIEEYIFETKRSKLKDRDLAKFASSQERGNFILDDKELKANLGFSGITQLSSQRICEQRIWEDEALRARLVPEEFCRLFLKFSKDDLRDPKTIKKMPVGSLKFFLTQFPEISDIILQHKTLYQTLSGWEFVTCGEKSLVKTMYILSEKPLCKQLLKEGMQSLMNLSTHLRDLASPYPMAIKYVLSNPELNKYVKDQEGWPENWRFLML